MKTFALGIEPGDDLTLTGHFLMRDAKAAVKFKGILAETKIDGSKSQRVVESPEEPSLTWQVRADAAGMREWLNAGRKK